MEMLTLAGLTKRFGLATVVDDISLTVNKGDVLGFLGPNGAGKSTTMKMVSGYLEPTRGTAQICGIDVTRDPIAAKRLMGYLPEGAPAYDDMNVTDFLTFVAGVRGYSGKERTGKVNRAIERAVLGEVRGQRIETLSKGFRRRVGIAQAIVHDPGVLVLDEPTDGLDPVQKHHVRDLIDGMSADKAIIVSTHILEEVDAICNRTAVISRGRLLLDSTPEEFAARAPDHNMTVLTVDAPQSGSLAVALSALPHVSHVEQSAADGGRVQLRITPKGREDVFTTVTDMAKEKDITVRGVSVERGSLDKAFRDVVGSEHEDKAVEVVDA